MMNSCVHLTRYSATRCGSFAHDLLMDGRRGRIIALFKSSLYLEAGGTIACIGDESLHACSLNVNTTAPGKLNWSANGLRTGASWRVLGRRLYVGGRYLIAMDGMKTWTTTVTPQHLNAIDLRRNVTVLRQLCAQRAPYEGLGRVAAGDDVTTQACLHNTAMAPLSGLRTWLTNAMSETRVSTSEHPHALHRLVGLGPGLTPSGDDFLCGVMFTLHTVGRGDVAERLWDWVRPLAAEAGNTISFGHLAVAAAGGGSAPIDALLTALLGGERGEFRQLLDAIDTVGHTSGWDCVAGVLTTTECWLAAPPARP